METKGIKNTIKEIKKARKALHDELVKANEIALDFQKEFLRAWNENTSILIISEAGIKKLYNKRENATEDKPSLLDDLIDDSMNVLASYGTKEKKFLYLSGLNAGAVINLNCLDSEDHCKYVSGGISFPSFTIICSKLTITSKGAEFSECGRKNISFPAFLFPNLVEDGIIEEYDSIEDLVLKINIEGGISN